MLLISQDLKMLTQLVQLVSRICEGFVDEGEIYTGIIPGKGRWEKSRASLDRESLKQVDHNRDQWEVLIRYPHK